MAKAGKSEISLKPTTVYLDAVDDAWLREIAHQDRKTKSEWARTTLKIAIAHWILVEHKRTKKKPSLPRAR